LGRVFVAGAIGRAGFRLKSLNAMLPMLEETLEQA
jgi:hypothetical protein